MSFGKLYLTQQPHTQNRTRFQCKLYDDLKPNDYFSNTLFQLYTSLVRRRWNITESVVWAGGKKEINGLSAVVAVSSYFSDSSSSAHKHMNTWPNSVRFDTHWNCVFFVWALEALRLHHSIYLYRWVENTPNTATMNRENDWLHKNRLLLHVRTFFLLCQLSFLFLSFTHFATVLLD